MDFSLYGGTSEQLRARLKYELEDERRRKRLMQQLAQPIQKSSGGVRNGYTGGRLTVSAPAVVSAPVSARPAVVRYTGIAMGSQSSVVKLASYGGGARAGAMIAYVSREGSLRMENERGEKLEHGDVSKVLSEWDPLMDNRAFSKDIAGFSVVIKGDFAGSSDLELREIGRSTIHDVLASRTENGEDSHSFAFGIERQGDSAAVLTGLMVLRSREGLRRTPDAKGEAMIARRIGETKGDLAVEAGRFRFTGYGNGVEYGTYQMRALVEKFDGQVTTDRGGTIGDDRQAGALVQRQWRKELHSRAPRDVMHLIMSAKAGTDAAAFEIAVRGFLAEQFGEQGHRYVFAMHDPASDPKAAEEGGQRPHVHAHAIITVKSDYGDRARNSPATFRAWRESMAEHARGQGIAMEMTDRRDVASAPAYTRNQVRPVSRQGRTEHEGTSRSAHARYCAKREGLSSYATSERSQQYRTEAGSTWGALALAADTKVARFAAAQVEHIRGVEGAQIIQIDERRGPSAAFEQNMVQLRAFIVEETKMADGEQRHIPSRSEFEIYEKSVNAAIYRAEREITIPDERSALDEFTQSVRDLVEARRAVVETAAELAEHAELRAQGVDVDAAYKAYDAAVEKHGAETVDAGNALLKNMNHAQDIWIEAGEPADPEHPATSIYLAELTAVVNAARDGNSYLSETIAESESFREAAEEIRKAERDADQAVQEDEADEYLHGADGKDADSSDDASAGSDDKESAEAEYQADERQQQDDEANDDTRALHEQQVRIDAATKAANKERDEQAARRDQVSSDPAYQQIPRQDEQQRERERDDDYEL